MSYLRMMLHGSRLGLRVLLSWISAGGGREGEDLSKQQVLVMNWMGQYGV